MKKVVIPVRPGLRIVTKWSFLVIPALEPGYSPCHNNRSFSYLPQPGIILLPQPGIMSLGTLCAVILLERVSSP